jgi:hypothetical protein
MQLMQTFEKNRTDSGFGPKRKKGLHCFFLIEEAGVLRKVEEDNWQYGVS